MAVAKRPRPKKGNVELKGHIKVPDCRLKAILHAVERHIALTRAEKGCIYFSVTQDHAERTRFNVYEIFEDRAAFDHHSRRAGASEWGEISKGVERRFEVRYV